MSSAPCPRCKLRHQCVCVRQPHVELNAHIALLTHPNEQQRDTNTGGLLSHTLSTCSVHTWQRTSPCDTLLTLMQNPRYRPFLLYPGEQSLTPQQASADADTHGATPLFIVLDGTWQEARKMLNKSTWLASLPCVQLSPQAASLYDLRRNQSEGHLCTYEVGAEIVHALGAPQEATCMREFFSYYLAAFQADKSGHALRT